MLGLPRAFIGAGARVVLSSLWAVPDESAKGIMIGWCARRAPRVPRATRALPAVGRALTAVLRLGARAAARRYRESIANGAPSLAVALQRAICASARRADGSWEDPVHWAGFTLTGNCASF